MELIASADDEGDKINIAIVALLEVEPEIRYLGMRADEAQYIQSCHAYLNCLKNECGSGLTAPPGNVLSAIYG